MNLNTRFDNNSAIWPRGIFTAIRLLPKKYCRSWTELNPFDREDREEYPERTSERFWISVPVKELFQRIILTLIGRCNDRKLNPNSENRLTYWKKYFAKALKLKRFLNQDYLLKFIAAFFITIIFSDNSFSSLLSDSIHQSNVNFLGKKSHLDENLQSVKNSFHIPSSIVILSAKLILDYSLISSKEKNLALNVRLNGENIGRINLFSDEHPHQVSLDLPAEVFLPENRISLGLYTSKYHDLLKPLSGQVHLKIFEQTSISYTFTVSSVIPKITDIPSVLIGDPENGHPISIVFPKNPSSKEMELATIFAAWIGSCERFTPLSFRVMNGTLPSEGSAIVFHYRGDVFEKKLPESLGMNIVRNPKDLKGIFLVVSGHQYSDLFSLSQSMVHRYRKRGDQCLPNDLGPKFAWLDQNKVSPLFTLTPSSHLSTHGIPPDPINIDFELPPNLLTWNADGILLHYRFNYDLPYLKPPLSLLIKVNQHPIFYYPLRSGPHGKLQNLTFEKDLKIPFYDLGRLNRISFEVVFNKSLVPFWRHRIFSHIRFAVDPNSTLQFQGSRAVAFLPDLCLWLHWGYPFTEHPDLSRTTIILDPKESDGVLSQYLDIMGRWGQVTGRVPSQMQVAFSDKSLPSDRNILVLGSIAWAKTQKKLFGSLPLTWLQDRVIPNPTMTQKIRLLFERLLSFKGISSVFEIHKKAQVLPPADLTIFSYPASRNPQKYIVAVLWKGAVKWNDPILAKLDNKRTEGEDRNSWLYVFLHGRKIDVIDLPTISRHSQGKWGIFSKIEYYLSTYVVLLFCIGGLSVYVLWLQADLIRRKQLHKRMRDQPKSV